MYVDTAPDGPLQAKLSSVFTLSARPFVSAVGPLQVWSHHTNRWTMRVWTWVAPVKARVHVRIFPAKYLSVGSEYVRKTDSVLGFPLHSR